MEISRSLGALPVYAGYSLLRIALAYFLSLVFAIVYGYIAAYRPGAERFMIPLLDVLQSIPVLSFLPGVMLAMAALFPGANWASRWVPSCSSLPDKSGTWHSVFMRR